MILHKCLDSWGHVPIRSRSRDRVPFEHFTGASQAGRAASLLQVCDVGETCKRC